MAIKRSLALYARSIAAVGFVLAGCGSDDPGATGDSSGQPNAAPLGYKPPSSTDSQGGGYGGGPDDGEGGHHDGGYSHPDGGHHELPSECDPRKPMPPVANLLVTTLEDVVALDGFCSLREAITAANANAAVNECTATDFDRITFGRNLAGAIVLGSTLPDSTDAKLTIDGGIGHYITISGNNTVKIMSVPAGSTVNLVNLRLVNGRDTAAGTGGAIENRGSLNLVGDELADNSATSVGGAIASFDAGVVVARLSTFARNSSSAGGAYYAEGTAGLVARDTTFANNSASPSAVGGAIALAQEATAVISQSTFVENTAGQGAAVDASNANGFVDLFNDTFTRNTATGLAGAVITSGNIQNDIHHVTFANNTSGIVGAVIGGFANAANSIFANNTGGNCNPAIIDRGGNIRWPVADASCIGTYGDPMLGLLADNGGVTQTMALLPGSAATDAGLTVYCQATDQRGVPRPQPTFGLCDSGAYESVVFPFAFTGFLAPTENPPANNRACAGDRVEISWKLAYASRRIDVLVPNSPASRTVDCTTHAALSPLYPTSPEGVNGLSVDNDEYTYAWRTAEGWAGTCRELQLTLVDGTVHSAFFRF